MKSDCDGRMSITFRKHNQINALFVCLIFSTVGVFSGCTVALPIAGMAIDALHPTTVAPTGVGTLGMGTPVSVFLELGETIKGRFQGIEPETAAVVVGGVNGQRDVQLVAISQAVKTEKRQGVRGARQSL